MPRAQVKAWSERRSEGGVVVVVIIGRPPEDVGAVLVERLGILGQRVVVATSGSKGLHLSVPLDDPITSS